MDHTPTTPAVDDRPIKILERTPVDDAHKQRLFGLVRVAQEAGAEAGKELQGEFGKEAVAMIVGCNQFLRLHRGGDHPGRVEILVQDDVKARLQEAGFSLGEPDGMVFKLFGWCAIDPMQGDPEVLAEAVRAAFADAAARARRSASSVASRGHCQRR